MEEFKKDLLELFQKHNIKFDNILSETSESLEETRHSFVFDNHSMYMIGNNNGVYYVKFMSVEQKREKPEQKGF